MRDRPAACAPTAELLSEWNVYLHHDERYISIRHRDAPGDTLLKCPEGWRDLERVRQFMAALAAAGVST